MAALHCTHILLAEFNIHTGALLKWQYPEPLGTDEQVLANLMLPDGAEKQKEDWTIFFLNQMPSNTIPKSCSPDNGEPELVHVLNLVRTKHDKTADRGAICKAMAICTPHSFIQIFKPVLLLALDDYFANESEECLANLYQAVNAMDLSSAPTLNRFEKLVMRTMDNKDIFREKFVTQLHEAPSNVPESSVGHPSSEDNRYQEEPRTRTVSLSSRASPSATDNSFTLGESAVWVGDDYSVEGTGSDYRPRLSLDDGSSLSSSYPTNGRSATPSAPRLPLAEAMTPRSTHLFETHILYKGFNLPIKVPMATFSEEVGDYSLVKLVQRFGSLTPMSVTGPIHPHIHSSGSTTHPILVLFNALVTGKRIIFLGHNLPAGEVSSYVMSACALATGCGVVLRGFVQRAFPYAMLVNRDDWESVPGYIAGVTNPIFETSGQWDLLCNLENGRMTVHKDIFTSHPPMNTQSAQLAAFRSGIPKSEISMNGEDDFGKVSSQAPRDGRETAMGNRPDLGSGKVETFDSIFMEDITTAVAYHYGEAHVRARFTDYVRRFVRLASRFEEELDSSTTIGFPSHQFTEKYADQTQLGGGMPSSDEFSLMKELAANQSRLEAWRRTDSYTLYQIDFKAYQANSAIQGFDVSYQIWRLRHAKQMPDLEVEMIMRTLADQVRTYDQVLELLSYLPSHSGGLMPLSFGLFHQQEAVRDITVEVLDVIRNYSVGYLFLLSLNTFHRYAYVRRSYAHELDMQKLGYSLYPPPALASRTPSNRSESSFGGV